MAFDRYDFEEMVAWLQQRRAADGFAYVVTPNVDHMVQIAADPARLRPIYDAATIRLCDSRILARLARMRGITLSVVPGSDLIVALFDRVLIAGDRYCLVGGSRELAESLRLKFPTLDLVHHQPPMGLRNDAQARAAAVRAAAEAGARFTLLAVGAPQQEILAYEMARDGGVFGTALCIGAAIDFIVGAQVRAPRAVQRAGMEWAWRLAGNPKRLARRYLWDGPKIFLLAFRWSKPNA
ncbi:WecB/TagA/CpsF family glycosyltransferase [Sphingomonas sp. GB1N7]|uniref:WecB/TagA/CpsF family glycosyltransferase n=1 Tax=Parasphingomonas caseinilytica TaxID=3096158 RepID=UPI002FCA8C9C